MPPFFDFTLPGCREQCIFPPQTNLRLDHGGETPVWTPWNNATSFRGLRSCGPTSVDVFRVISTHRSRTIFRVGHSSIHQFKLSWLLLSVASSRFTHVKGTAWPRVVLRILSRFPPHVFFTFFSLLLNTPLPVSTSLHFSDLSASCTISILVYWSTQSLNLLILRTQTFSCN